MPTRPAEQPTTQEHQPPRATRAVRGRPILLAAFPTQVALPLPPPGEPAGRAWLAEAGLVDPKASGHHLRITRTRGRLEIEDAGSRNGTWIDGYRLQPGERAPLEDGTILRVGGTLLVYREAFDGPLAPQPPLGRLVGPFGLAGLRAEIEKLSARRELRVLLQGETGTGKELLAEVVAGALGRAHSFGRINIAGLAPTLFEGQLFGWERGAFSGSQEASPGVLRKHNRGAVFLDEIGELPLDLQPKLLRVIDNGEVLPLGASQPAPADVAIVAATNRDLEECVERGTFRRDLLARFRVRLSLPPLRDRPEDAFAIARALWELRHGPFRGAPVEVEAVEHLMMHGWPANVRDLDRLILGLDPAAGIDLASVEHALGQRAGRSAPPPTREAIERTVAACGGNKKKAAEQLGISRGRLYRLLDEQKRG